MRTPQRLDNIGFNLIEVMIASIVLAIIGIAGLKTMSSSVGFTTTAGRQEEALANSVEEFEDLRNVLRPGAGVSNRQRNVMLNNVPGTLARTTRLFPDAPPGSTLAQMWEVTTRVNWTEPR